MHDGTIVTVRDAADAYKRLAAVHARTRYNPQRIRACAWFSRAMFLSLDTQSVDNCL
jgi:hypothetical protein